MTNSNSRDERMQSIGVVVGHSTSEGSTDELPDDSQALVAKKAAIEAKIEMVVVPAMQARWRREAAGIGKTAEEVLGIKKRGRKPKQKQDE